MKHVAIYARVSTGEQTPDNQLRDLRAVAERMGWQVVEEFVDHGISGAKGRDQRPAYDCIFRANWTAVPPQTGHLFHRKLDTCSAANWRAVPGQTGQSERSDARG